MSKYPEAEIASKKPRKFLAWLTLFLVTVAFIGGLYWFLNGSRRLISISFQDSHFLKTRDLLRYRSVVIGEVVSIEPAPDLKSVRVEALIHPHAWGVAREGSRFWIVRPQIDLYGVRGLETVLGSNYIRVIPGSGTPQTTFIGLDTPPVFEDVSSGTTEISLTTPRGEGLKAGMPITYRNTKIGVVSSLNLLRNASGVEVKGLIYKEYSSFVASGAYFCRASGVKFSADLFAGLNWSVSPLKSMVSSEIQLFLPNRIPFPNAEVRRFRLFDFPPKEAQNWQPSLAFGNDSIKSFLPCVPEVLGVEIPPSSYFGSKVRVSGINLAGGVLMPDLSRFELENLTIEKQTRTAKSCKSVSGCWFLEGSFASEAWPAESIKPLPTGVDLFVVFDKNLQPFFLPKEILENEGKSVSLESELEISPEWDGCPVIDKNQNLVGMLANPEGKGKWRVLPIPVWSEKANK